jgi:hypothetical protein
MKPLILRCAACCQLLAQPTRSFPYCRGTVTMDDLITRSGEFGFVDELCSAARGICQDACRFLNFLGRKFRTNAFLPCLS